MTELRKRLEDNPYLVIDCAAGEASLMSAAETLNVFSSGTHFVLDAASAFDRLKGLTPDKTTYSLTEIAKIGGIDYHGAHAWLRNGVIVASISPQAGAGRGRGPQFSLEDAFVAGIVGTLRRHNLPLAVARGIVPLFSGGARNGSTRS